MVRESLGFVWLIALRAIDQWQLWLIHFPPHLHRLFPRSWHSIYHHHHHHHHHHNPTYSHMILSYWLAFSLTTPFSSSSDISFLRSLLTLYSSLFFSLSNLPSRSAFRLLSSPINSQLRFHSFYPNPSWPLNHWFFSPFSISFILNLLAITSHLSALPPYEFTVIHIYPLTSIFSYLRYLATALLSPPQPLLPSSLTFSPLPLYFSHYSFPRYYLSSLSTPTSSITDLLVRFPFHPLAITFSFSFLFRWVLASL